VFEGDGEIRDFPGNYSQYREWQKKQEEELKEEKKPEQSVENTSTKIKKKLSFNEQREFDLLEKEIATLEKERQEIYIKLNDPSIPYEQLQKLTGRIGVINDTIDEKEMRWLELSEII
jgi:ATP-binding cassette subfamily F protein uup